MTNNALTVVYSFLTAVQQGAFDKLGALLHPEVQWEQPGNNPLAGTKRSVKEVFEMVGGMFAITHNTLSLSAIKVLAVNGNKVACLLQWTSTQPAAHALNVNNIDVYTVDNGQIVHVTVFTEDPEQEDALWSLPAPAVFA